VEIAKMIADSVPADSLRDSCWHALIVALFPPATDVSKPEMVTAAIQLKALIARISDSDDSARMKMDRLVSGITHTLSGIPIRRIDSAGVAGSIGFLVMVGVNGLGPAGIITSVADAVWWLSQVVEADVTAGEILDSMMHKSETVKRVWWGAIQSWFQVLSAVAPPEGSLTSDIKVTGGASAPDAGKNGRNVVVNGTRVKLLSLEHSQDDNVVTVAHRGSERVFSIRPLAERPRVFVRFITGAVVTLSGTDDYTNRNSCWGPEYANNCAPASLASLPWWLLALIDQAKELLEGANVTAANQLSVPRDMIDAGMEYVATVIRLIGRLEKQWMTQIDANPGVRRGASGKAAVDEELRYQEARVVYVVLGVWNAALNRKVDVTTLSRAANYQWLRTVTEDDLHYMYSHCDVVRESTVSSAFSVGSPRATAASYERYLSGPLRRGYPSSHTKGAAAGGRDDDEEDGEEASASGPAKAKGKGASKSN
jgi:hypothetical protein